MLGALETLKRNWIWLGTTALLLVAVLFFQNFEAIVIPSEAQLSIECLEHTQRDDIQTKNRNWQPNYWTTIQNIADAHGTAENADPAASKIDQDCKVAAYTKALTRA